MALTASLWFQERTVKELLDSGFLDSDYISSSEAEESQISDTEQSTVDPIPSASAKCESVPPTGNGSVCDVESGRNLYSGGSAFQRANQLLHSHWNFGARDPCDSHRSSFFLSRPSEHSMTTSRASRSMANLQYALPLQPVLAVSERMNVGSQPLQRSNSMPNLMAGAYPTPLYSASPLYSRSFCQLPPVTTIMRHFLRL